MITRDDNKAEARDKARGGMCGACAVGECGFCYSGEKGYAIGCACSCGGAEHRSLLAKMAALEAEAGRPPECGICKYPTRDLPARDVEGAAICAECAALIARKA